MLGILFRGRRLRSCFVETRRAVRGCLLGSGAGSGHPCLQEGRSDNASGCACCRRLRRVVRLGRMLSLLRGRRNKARFEENKALKDLFNFIETCQAALPRMWPLPSRRRSVMCHVPPPGAQMKRKSHVRRTVAVRYF